MHRWAVISTLVTALVVGLAPGSASIAHAQAAPEPDGWYIAAGLALHHRATAEDLQGAATEFKQPGLIISGALGYRWDRLRVEGETAYVYNRNAREIVTGVLDEVGEGNIALRVYAMNVFYDFPLGGPWLPYVGGGVGMFQSQVNGLTSPTLLSGIPNPAGGFFLEPTVVQARSNFTFAYQLRAGAAYVVNEKTDVVFGYRFLGGNEFVLHTPTLGRLDVGGPRVHGFEVGVRAKF